MCLYITWDSTKRKRAARKKTEKIIAYKVLMSVKKALYSPYLGIRWYTNKEMVSSRRGENPTRLTKLESKEQEIYDGLHFFQTFARADKMRRCDSKCKIYRVAIDPQDIVAFGDDDIVAHKAKIIGRVN